MSGRAPRTDYEVSLRDWRVANLHGPGTVRVGAGCPIAKQRIGRVIGKVSRNDADRIAQVFAALFSTPDLHPTMEEELNLVLS